MKKYYLPWMIILALSGCGGGGTNSSNNTAPDYSGGGSGEIDMITDRSYTVYAGDRIVKTSEPSAVWIHHVDGESSSTVQLLEGSAKLIRH